MTSHALSIVQTVSQRWGECGMTHSWTRLNGDVFAAIRLAIQSGLRFAEDDYAAMVEITRGHLTSANVEQLHALACKEGNKSAADSIDRHLGRKALLFGKHFVGFEPPRNALRNRVFVGAQIRRDDVGPVFVTSFGADGESVTACLYHPYPDHSKVKARYRYTRADLSPPAPKEGSP